MATVLEARAVITGQDDTGPAFASVERRLAAIAKTSTVADRVAQAYSKSMVAAMSKIGKVNLDSAVASERMIAGLSKAGGEAASVAEKIAAIGDAAVASERKIGMMSRAAATMKDSFKSVAPFMEGYLGSKVFHATELAVKGGADLETERVRMSVAGIPAAEARTAEDLSFKLAAQYPTQTPADVMKTYRETRSVLAEVGNAPNAMPGVVAAKTVLSALGGENDSEALIFAMKAAENLGRGQDPKRFYNYLDSFVRAREAMGATIKPETILRFAQQAKSSGAVLSDRFLQTTMMSLAQELGSRGGSSLAAYQKVIAGDVSGQGAELWKQIGFLSEDDLLRTRTGKVTGLKPGHHIKDFEEAMVDPDLFVWGKLLPALGARGFKTIPQQVEAIDRLFHESNAQNLVAKLVQQQTTFQAQQQKMANTQGLDAAQKITDNDPTAALTAFTKQLQSFGATMTSPAMKDAATALSGLAKGIGGFVDIVHGFDEDHPLAAKIIADTAIPTGVAAGGLLTFGFVRGVMGGFGLKTSAAALDASAAALDEAAVALKGAPVASVPKSAAPAAASAGAGAAITAALSTGISAGLAGGLVTMDIIKQDASHGDELRSSLRSFLGIPDPHEPAPWMPGGAWHKDALPEVAVNGRDIGHIGKSLSDDLAILAERPVHVDGTIQGAAQIIIGLTPEASRAIATAKQVSVNLKGSLQSGGNLGESMPEAMPTRRQD